MQFIAGLIGVPAPNGLIPQAPIHTTSLLIMKHSKPDEDEEERKSESDNLNDQPLNFTERPVAVVEQRVSNLAQGALCLVLLTGPFLHVLHLIPRGVFSAALCPVPIQLSVRCPCRSLVRIMFFPFVFD